MKGTVEELSREVSKRGDEYLRVQIDGEKYSIWDPQYIGSFDVGDSLEFEYKESGQWKNITSLAVDEVENPNIPPTDTYRMAHDRRIARMSCVKSAAYVLANLEMEAEPKGEQTLTLARVFERYIYDEDLNHPIAPTE